MDESDRTSPLYNHPLTGRIIGCAIKVHRFLGPGLLESAYERCLLKELELSGLTFENQKAVSVMYEGFEIDCAYRIVLLVEEFVVVEVKSVESILPVHSAQILTYMKLTETPLGLLINFNVPLLKFGVRKYSLNDASHSPTV